MMKNKLFGFLVVPALLGIFVLAFAGCNVGTVIENFNITYQANVEGGTITVSPSVATAGTTISLTAIPAGGNVFGEWVITPPVTILPNANSPTATFMMPANDVVVSATFGELRFPIIRQPPTGNGTFMVSPDTDTVAVGAHVTLTADPDPGHELGIWIIHPAPTVFVNGNFTTSPVTFVMPNTPLTVGAVFIHEDDELDTFAVTLMPPVGAGEIQIVSPADLAAVVPGMFVSLMAVPGSGYALTAWSATPNVGFLPSATATTVSFVMPSADVEVSVAFEAIHTPGNGVEWFPRPENLVAGSPTAPGTEMTAFDWFATPGSFDPEYTGWNAPVALGYWVSGIGLGGYVFYHMEAEYPPLAGPIGAPHINQLSGFFTQHPANGIGREFMTANLPTSIPVPSGADGITFWALTGEEERRVREPLATEGAANLQGTWNFFVECVEGNTASIYFEIGESWVRENFALIFPDDFNPSAIATYGFFQIPAGYFDWAYLPGDQSPPAPAVYGFLRISRMSFFQF